MKHILFAVAFVSVLLTADVTLGQTASTGKPAAPHGSGPKPQPAPQVRSWWETVPADRPNLAATTKRTLYEHSPLVCHCDECRRARLAAGIEYLGPLYAPAYGSGPYVYCSGLGMVRKSLCPER
ncbi:MAG: hypothetical protein R6V57_19855 [Vicinamibacterales bacterium]